MNRTRRSMLCAAIVAAFCLSAAVRGEEIKKVNAIYFGNSYTGNTMIGLQPLLAESAGRKWTVEMLGGAGQPPWTHMMRLIKGDPKFASFKRDGANTDVLSILIYGGTGLRHIVIGEKWGHKFDQPTDIGDVAACSYLIREYFKLNPKGRAFIYTAWPGIPAAGALAREVNKGKSKKDSRDLTHEEMEPVRKAFDYPAAWLTKDYIANPPDGIQERIGKYLGALRSKLAEESPVDISVLATGTGFDSATVKSDLAAFGLGDSPTSAQKINDAVTLYRDRSEGSTHSRPHMYAAMDAVIKNFPEVWKEGRLGMVPVGDVFLELDKKMKAGQIPGLVNVGEFSADGGHLRGGLPRYVLAATHYAVLFKDYPRNVDWKIFQEKGNYESGKFNKVYVHQPDLGVHMDITPERAQIVNETIWEVGCKHPYTQVDQGRN